jgi:hypothetical protein
VTEMVVHRELSARPNTSTTLSGEQRRNLALASRRSILEFYEFTVFGFFTIVIGNLFFLSDLPRL